MPLIIDIHTHAFPERIASRAVRSLQQNCHTALFSDGTENGLLRAERDAGVHLAVVQPVATNPEKVSRMNDSVLAANAVFSSRGLLSFGAMHPACPGWEAELEKLKAAGVPGIKLHPPYTGIAMEDPRTISVLRRCRELNLIVLLHSGWDVGLPGAEESLPSGIRRALDAAGPLKLIAGHMGGWGCWEEALRLLAGTGVYVDTAFSLGAMTPAGDGHPWREEDLLLLDPETFCGLVRGYGADHVLFGTDSPWASPRQELEKLRALPLSSGELEGILGENARKLLGLP